MKFNVSKIKEICGKYGFYLKKTDKNEFTYPGMESSGFAVAISYFHDDYVICAVDIIDCQRDYLSGFADSRIGFYDTQQIYSYEELVKKLIFLKNKIKEFKRKLKLENIEKDF